ncbi:sensor histidine kinase [Plebeiibacterium marinum]|uniref:histidine kinase n=1 Tax=Plebeiibacterium marinum TaxID=2992111 RepID=A0AAE3SJI7_9BACT|nr:two-component regulator propeller domain-containing protein [Plebeiobacterium marinum]MCW3804400.1 ATP-binding protein [Plebeiobacterium marinum]
MQKVFYYILLLFVTTSAVAQHHFFKQYSLEEGLPQSEVNDIAEDEYGYLWLGTNGGGLCRFNGSDFEVLTKKNGLVEDLIMGLHSDNNFNLWIASQKGITKYNGKTFEYVIKSDTALFQDRVEFLETIDGSVWALVREVSGLRKILRFKDNTIEDFHLEYPDYFSNNKIFFLCKGDPHSLFVSTRNGLFSINAEGINKVEKIGSVNTQKETLIPVLQDKYRNVWALGFDKNENMLLKKIKFNGDVEIINWPKTIPLQKIFRAFEDRQGNVWISIASSGVVRIKGGDIKVFNKQNGLKATLITSFCEDREGNLWFGTSGSGLLKYGGDKFVAFNKESGLSGDIIRMLFEDSQGNVYFGDDNNTISKYDGKKIMQLKVSAKCQMGQARRMVELQDGNMLIATTGGLFQYDGNIISEAANKYGITCQAPVIDIVQHKNELWFGVYGTGLLKVSNGQKKWYTPKNSDLKSGYINHILIDSKDRMWISTTKGVFLFQDNAFQHYSDKDELNASWVLQSAEDKIGNIWFATFTGGLNRYDGEGFSVFDTSNGITSDNIYSVIADEEGNIWAGTQNGVDKITITADGNIPTIQNFDKNDGFIGIENNGGCNLLDSKGHIWFGTIRGAMRYNPEEEKVNYLEPPVYIQKVLLNFKNQEWHQKSNEYKIDSLSPWFSMPEGLQLRHTNNHVGFVFDALCYTASEKTRYKWKLDPIEEEWSPQNSVNRAFYPSLSPGKYTFRVIACNNNDVWNNEGATFSFEIIPAWYQYNIVKLAGILMLLCLVVIIVRQRIIKEKAIKQELEARIAIKKVEIRKQQSEIEKRNKELKEQKSQLQLQAASLQASNNNLERLTEIGQLITANLTVSKIAQLVYQSVSKVMSCDVYTVGIYNEELKSIDFVYSSMHGEQQPFIRYQVDDKERLAVYSFIHNKEVFLNNFSDDYKKYLSEIRPVPSGAETESVIYVPLRTAKKNIGVISVQSLKKNAYTPYHLNFMQNIANYASVAIGNALKFQKLVDQQKLLKNEHESVLGEKNLLTTEKQLLEDANYEKMQLLNLFANGVQEPLSNSICELEGFLSASKNCSTEQQVFLNNLLQSLQQQNDIVNKVLEVHHIESGRYEFTPLKFELKHVINGVVEKLANNANEKNIEIVTSGKALETTLDKVLFVKIMDNLISNAIKFSPKNKQVRVILSELNGMVHIEVHDQGPGLTNEEQSKVFKKYSKLNKSGEQELASSGLGLYIVKKYVDKMNGTIKCESIAGFGASFVLEFPLK